jgi:hypothetical protein
MGKFQKSVVIVLGAISTAGVFGIPLGDPRFIIQAIVLEGCFVALAVLSAKNYKKAYLPNFVIAIIVIIGNSVFYKHIEIMTTFHPLYNAIVLITGGYVLQGLLLITNALAYRQQRQSILSNKTS